MMQSVITWKYLRSFIKIYSELGLKVQKSEIPMYSSEQPFPQKHFSPETELRKRQRVLVACWLRRALPHSGRHSAYPCARTHTRAPCFLTLIFLHSTCYLLIHCIFLYLLIICLPPPGTETPWGEEGLCSLVYFPRAKNSSQQLVYSQ